MGPIGPIFGSLLYLLIVALDVAIVLIAVRGAVRRWPAAPLAALEATGRPVTDYALGLITQAATRLGLTPPREPVGLLAALIAGLAVRTAAVVCLNTLA